MAFERIYQSVQATPIGAAIEEIAVDDHVPASLDTVLDICDSQGLRLDLFEWLLARRLESW